MPTPWSTVGRSRKRRASWIDAGEVLSFPPLIDKAGSSALTAIERETMAKTKKTFRVEVEVKVDVEAFDEASAKKKVEKLLGSRRSLGADVVATGDVWTYAAPLVRDPRKAAAGTAAAG